MENYIYIEKVSLAKIIAGNLLLFSGVLGMIFINIQLGPTLIFLWIFLCFAGVFFLSTEGIEIDFKTTNYRKVVSIYGINYGLSWNYYPKIKYIALLETNVKQTIGGRTFNSTATATISSKKVKINLFEENNRFKTLYLANNRAEALKIAEALKSIYNIEITDNF